MRSVSYTFDAMNSFWENDLDNTCTDAMNAYAQCASNTIITNANQCFRLTYFNTFQMEQTTYAYAWMYFDSLAAQKVFGYCSQKVSNWNISYTSFQASLQFAFGTILSN